MLFFESSQEAHQFCEFYGLEIQDDAVLERSSFIIPETAFPPMRSRKCIEMKRFLPVGEVNISFFLRDSSTVIINYNKHNF